MKKLFCILAHGMNLSPQRMGEFENIFKNWNAETYNLTFHGHYPGKVDEYNTATFDHWLGDFDQAFQYYQKNFQHLSVCVVGYSLGGLVAVSYLQKNEEFRKKMPKLILVAPAIAPRDYLIWIAQTTGYPDIPIPSLNIRNYNVHTWSSARVNNEVYRLIKTLNPPTESQALILLNPKDELISYKNTARFIENHKLKNWKVLKARPSRTWLKPIPQHLFIDEKTMGKKLWEELQREIYNFINP